MLFMRGEITTGEGLERSVQNSKIEVEAVEPVEGASSSRVTIFLLFATRRSKSRLLRYFRKRLFCPAVTCAEATSAFSLCRFAVIVSDPLENILSHGAELAVNAKYTYVLTK